MASTPNFFLFSGLLFLARFTADVHSVKVLSDVLKGSRVVLRPVESVASITTISWKHGDNIAAEWNGEELTFYNIFKDTCSLNTTTGELTINNVRPEHSGVYTPDINLKTRSAMKLRVFSPVPKPSISHDCYPGETLTCTLRCMHTCMLDNVGHMEVSWILDDRRVNGSELPITKDSKEETFICSVKNSVSSENSTKLLNPLLPGDTGVPVWIPVVGTLASLASIALLAFVCWKWIYPLYRRYRMIKEIQETKPLTEHKRITDEIHAAGAVTEEDQKVQDVYEVCWSVIREGDNPAIMPVHLMICRILEEGNALNLSEDGILELLTARYLILSILKEVPAVQESLENVEKMIEKFFKGRHELQQYKDEEMTPLHVDEMIDSISRKANELNVSVEEAHTLWRVQEMISRTILLKGDLWELEERIRLNEEDQKLEDVDEGIEWILSKKEDLKLSEEEEETLQEVHLRISTMIFNMKERMEDEGSAAGGGVDQPEEDLKLLKVDKMISRILNMKKELKLSYEEKIALQHVQRTLSVVIIQKEDEEKEQRRLNGASNHTTRPRDPAAEPLMSSSSGPEAEDKV